MSIPLINDVNKNDINTSIIAIKKDLERINTLLGLNNTEEIDTSVFATKEELEQAETDLAPVDEVTSGNMQSVTSNAVAQALGDSLGEQRIGTWIDGSPLYKKVIVFNVPQNGAYIIPIDVSNFKNLVKWSGNFFQGGYQAPQWIMHIPYTYIDQLVPSDILNIYVYFDQNTLSFRTSFYGLGQYSSEYYNGQGILYIEYTKNS